MRRRIDHFAFIATWYDRLLRRPERDPLPGLVCAEPGQLVLDIGGGTGRCAGKLSQAGARVVVCDLSREMLREARAKGVTGVRGSVTRLPFPTNSAERILVVDAFHHFVDPSPRVAQPEAVREMLRVLKPGGRIVVEEPDIRQLSVRPIAWMETALLMGSRFLSPATLIRMFEADGAIVLDRRYEDATAWLVFAKTPSQGAK